MTTGLKLTLLGDDVTFVCHLHQQKCLPAIEEMGPPSSRVYPLPLSPNGNTLGFCLTQSFQNNYSFLF